MYKKAILSGAFLGILTAVVLFVGGNKAPVQANPNHWENVGSCQQLQCGSAEGTQDQVCVKGGGGSNCHPASDSCPQGSLEVNHKCYQWQSYHYVEVDKVHHDADTRQISCEVSEPYQCEPEEVLGCTDSGATNYNSEATEDDGSCEYPVEEVPVHQDNWQYGGAPVCTDGGTPKYAPTVTYAWRTGTDALVKWTTTDVQDFILYYGPTGKELTQHTEVFHNSDANPAYTIHNVNQMIDVQACSVSACGAVNCGVRFIDP